MVVKFGEDALENPGEMRTINKSCVRVACPDPWTEEAFSNGKVVAPFSQKYFLSGDDVKLQCDPYHVMENDNTNEIVKTLTCKNSGQWSEPFPNCTQCK